MHADMHGTDRSDNQTPRLAVTRTERNWQRSGMGGLMRDEKAPPVLDESGKSSGAGSAAGESPEGPTDQHEPADKRGTRVRKGIPEGSRTPGSAEGERD